MSQSVYTSASSRSAAVKVGWWANPGKRFHDFRAVKYVDQRYRSTQNAPI